MYAILLALHSIFRWFAFFGLLFAFFRGVSGWSGKRPFDKTDNLSRTLAVIFTHIQFLIGLILLFQSPLTQAVFSGNARGNTEATFFVHIHTTLMLIAVVLMTIGSAKAKRAADNQKKFRLMATYFGIALVLVLVAIPWPFSPLAARPWIRGF